jgi:hypothetical protein
VDLEEGGVLAAARDVADVSDNFRGGILGVARRNPAPHAAVRVKCVNVHAADAYNRQGTRRGVGERGGT